MRDSSDGNGISLYLRYLDASVTLSYFKRKFTQTLTQQPIQLTPVQLILADPVLRGGNKWQTKA